MCEWSPLKLATLWQQTWVGVVGITRKGHIFISISVLLEVFQISVKRPLTVLVVLVVVVLRMRGLIRARWWVLWTDKRDKVSYWHGTCGKPKMVTSCKSAPFQWTLNTTSKSRLCDDPMSCHGLTWALVGASCEPVHLLNFTQSSHTRSSVPA